MHQTVKMFKHINNKISILILINFTKNPITAAPTGGLSANLTGFRRYLKDTQTDSL